MGQRLNLQIEKSGKRLANAYYHWSAYTGSAASLASEVINYLDDHQDMKDKKLLAIRALESTGAGFSTYEEGQVQLEKLHSTRVYMNKEFDIQSDRNEGLISCYASHMDNTATWADGSVIIDIDTRTIDTTCFNMWTLEEFKEDNPDTDLTILSDFGSADIPFDDFFDISERLVDGECFYNKVEDYVWTCLG